MTQMLFHRLLQLVDRFVDKKGFEPVTAKLATLGLGI
jgi:hypothetical protein